MSDIEDQIAAAQAAAAAAATASDGMTETLSDLSAAVRSVVALVAEAKLAADAVIAPADPEPTTVLTYGADPTGVVDSTSAINTAIAAGFGIIPAGTYKVSAGTDNKAIKIGAGKTLTFDDTDGEVTINLVANSKPRYYIVYGSGDGIQILGRGHLKGDRLAHTYTTGSTHEWGYGCYVTGDSTLVEDLKVSEVTGDGFGFSGAGVTTRRILATKCRRQGMSLFSVVNFNAYDSEFSLTGALLTDAAAPNGPCAGVDMEPDSAVAASATFTRCKFNGNRAGFLAWLRSEVGGSISFTLTNCEMLGNANGVQAKALAGAITGTVTGSMLSNNRGAGVRIETGATLTINNNVFDSVTERTDFTLAGVDTRTRYDILRVGTTPTPTVGTNKYV